MKSHPETGLSPTAATPAKVPDQTCHRRSVLSFGNMASRIWMYECVIQVGCFPVLAEERHEVKSHPETKFSLGVCFLSTTAKRRHDVKRCSAPPFSLIAAAPKYVMEHAIGRYTFLQIGQVYG